MKSDRGLIELGNKKSPVLRERNERDRNFGDNLMALSEVCASLKSTTHKHEYEAEVTERPEIRYVTRCRIEGISCRALLDSGSERTLLSEEKYKSCT